MKKIDDSGKHGLWERLLFCISPAYKTLAELRAEHGRLKSELHRLTNADAAFALAMENNTNTAEIRNEIGKIKTMLLSNLMTEIKKEVHAVENKVLAAYGKELSKSSEKLCADMRKIIIENCERTMDLTRRMQEEREEKMRQLVSVGNKELLDSVSASGENLMSILDVSVGECRAFSKTQEEKLAHIEKRISPIPKLFACIDNFQEMILHAADLHAVGLNTILDDIRTVILSNSTIVGDLRDTLQAKMDCIQACLSAETEKNARDRMHFKDDMETFFINKFMNELATMDYRQEYSRLISNLDSAGQATVSNILRRISEVDRSNGVACLDLLSSSEIRKRREIMTKFWLSVVKISDSCWAYKNYLLPIEHFETGNFFFEYGIPNLRHKERIYKRDIIDAGAFIGDSSLVMSKYTGCSVHAFEPMQANFDFLLQTIKMNSVVNIIPHKIALGSKNGKRKFYAQGSASGEVKIPGIGGGELSEECPVISLDSFVNEKHINVGLIKADLEGGEYDMLLGAKETIFRDRPVLILSIYHSARDFFTIKTLLESWNLGYRFTITKFPDHYILIDTILVAEPV